MEQIKDIKDFQELQLKIMDKIHSFCVENNINYFLAYGTLLGAIRHNGFIPWDDDIDIFMFREDYERFLSIFPNYCDKEELGIANNRNKEYFFCRPMTKIFDKRTYLKELDYRTDKPYGVFVDIWVLDNLPETNKNKILKKMVNRKRILYLSCLKFQRNLSFKRNMLILFGRLFNPKYLCKKFEKICQSYNKEPSNYIACYIGLDNSCIYFEKNDFIPIMHKFSNRTFFIPSGYDKFLHLRYGHYMQLPPKSQQKIHHNFIAYIK